MFRRFFALIYRAECWDILLKKREENEGHKFGENKGRGKPWIWTNCK